MLYGRCDEVASLVAAALRDAADREVIGLGGARREDDAGCPAAHQPGHLGAGGFERLTGLESERVGRGRIADAGLEEGPHDVENARINRREPRVVEVYPVGSDAPALHAATGSS